MRAVAELWRGALKGEGFALIRGGSLRARDGMSCCGRFRHRRYVNHLHGGWRRRQLLLMLLLMQRVMLLARFAVGR